MTADEILTPIIKTAQAANPAREGDYLQGGILYCGNCKTPKQVAITVSEKTYVVPCLCACAEEAYKREEKERKDRERLAEIKALRINGIQDTSIREMTFANDDGKDGALIAKAKRYATKWDKMLRDNIGLLFWGDTGNGKTYAAACIANALLDKGVPVLMTSFPQLLNSLTGMFANDRVEYINSLRSFKLLGIDDLGTERDSAFAREQVYTVIDARYKQQLPMIITTNLQLRELQNPKDIECKRIYDRVLEMCVPIQVTGENRRKAKAANKIKLAKAMFE